MIKDLTIKNFKTHRDLEMKDLANVNILLGKNNSGKTAVLEALFLLYHSLNRTDTHVTLDLLNYMRGYINGADSGEKWNSLFYNWDFSKEIYIEAKEDVEQNNTEKDNIRSLSIKPIITGKRPDSFSAIGVMDLSGITKGLSWTITYPSGNSVKYQIEDLDTMTEQQKIEDNENLLASFKEAIIVRTDFISARGLTNIRREAERFSRLEVENRVDKINELLKILRNFEPNLKRLFIGATKNGTTIYGDIGLDRPIPLPLMGDGMLHAFSIALSMVNSQNGLVLIDEIENGLHYSVLTEVWRMILQTSHDLIVQVFATTHSDECLKAAYEAVDSLEYYDNLKLFRFDRTEDETKVVDYSTKQLLYAIASEQEVR